MLALKILDVKQFMNMLLLGDAFDYFELVEASITTFNTFLIDGTLKRDFFDTDTCDILDQKGITYSLWKDIKSYCYSIIRGKRTPLHFKIIFQLPEKWKTAVLNNAGLTLPPELVKGLFLNLRFKNQELLCTTGISLCTFSPDKTPEHLWEDTVINFFHKQNITFQTL